MIHFGGKQAAVITIDSKSVTKIIMSGDQVFPAGGIGNKPVSPAAVTYTGSLQTNGYTCPANVTMSGTSAGTDAGTYTAVYTPNAGYYWSDYTNDSVTVTLTIVKASVGAKPSATVTRTYTGSTQTNGYVVPGGVTVTGDSSGKDAGTYTAEYTPDSNHKWGDGTNDTVAIVMTINRASAGAKPTNPEAVTYDGNLHTNGYTAPSGVIVIGDDLGTDADTYTAVYWPDANHCWSDNTTDSVTITLTINRASVGAKPGTSVTRTYSGSTQTNGYTTPAHVTVTGSTSGIRAGTYEATYTPDNNYCWSDNTYASVTLTMTINRASVGSQPTSPSAITYDGNIHTNGYTCPAGVVCSGYTSGTNAGSYVATYTPDANHCWRTGTTTRITVTLTITPAYCGYKPLSPVYTSYDGTIQDNCYTTPTGVTVTGETSGTNAGSYTATYTPDSNHMWRDDDSQTAYDLVLIISKIPNPATVVSSQSCTSYSSPGGISTVITGAANAQGTVTYSIFSQKKSGETVDNFYISGTTVTGVNLSVGTYTVLIAVNIAGNNNYYAANDWITLTWTVIERP